LEPGGDPVRAMRELRKVCDRWLIDNGGDVLVWGQVAPSGSIVHIRFFVRDEGVIDPFRIGDGWSLLVLPQPLDISGAHRIHAAVLAAVRSKAAGKLLTVKRDLEVLMADARDHLVAETANLDPLESAEDKLARGRIFANTMRFKRRADDAKTALALIDSALTVFSAEQTPIEWALAHKDRAFLGQFIAERTNDTDALRTSMQDVEAALTILRPSLFPQDWAALNDRLGLALYRLDFDNGDTATLERALQAFHDALSVYDRQKTPSEWAEAMGHFGQVALVIGRETRNPKMLLRAIEACNAVVGVRDRKYTPMHWASAQNNLGSAMFLYGRIAADTGALRGARDAFRTAHQIYNEKGADRLARVTEKNMRHVDTALTRKPRPEPPSLPWEPEGNQPPSLPWEFESPNR
jgi:tetratricopeptide (TPR) repeat protein